MMFSRTKMMTCFFTVGMAFTIVSAIANQATEQRSLPKRLTLPAQFHQHRSSSVETGSSDSNSTSTCRCIPGDDCWPGTDLWKSLNSTVHGRLSATVPLAHVCHGSSFNANACDVLKEGWSESQTHLFYGGDFDAPYFQNQSCDPFTSQNTTCALGNYPSYFVNVTGAEDVIAGIKFAAKNNIRLVIKNTGHDYLGRSSGKGALSLWTFNLKETTFIESYNGSSLYSGPALKVGAGIMFSEAYTFANAHGHTVVGGSCATVGMAGGFSQGGGHGPLMSHYGMGADNVLEWEVVTPSGHLVTATAHGNNSDLYWALSGGGPGNWGVVVSMTTKAHPTMPIGGASLIVSSAGLAEETYWDAVSAFMENSTSMLAGGSYMTVTISGEELNLWALTSPNLTAQQVAVQLSPYTQYLEENNITSTLKTTYFGNMVDHMESYFGSFPYGIQPIAQLTGGRLISRELLQNRASISELTDTVRSSVLNGDFYVAYDMFDLQATQTAIAAHSGRSKNSILPAWNDSLASMIVVGTWDFTIPHQQMMAREDELTEVIMPAVRKVTPGGYAYLNEADFNEPDWQETFYGSNYPRLSQIKKSIDPEGLFYGITAVGSERWAEDNQGRLCRV